MTATALRKSDSLTAGQLPRWATPAILVGSIALAVLVTLLLGPFNVGLAAVFAFVIHQVATYLTSRLVEGPRRATDRMMTGFIIGAFLLALVPLVWVAATTLANGLNRFDLSFFNNSMRNVDGVGGGAVHAIYGTLMITGFATVISVPVGLLTAIYLSEYGRGHLARGITFFVDVMTGIPSIVAGLFAYALMTLLLGPGTVSGFSGSLALSVLMIPVVVRSTEELLKIVPNELREASYALGVPKWRTILRIVLPTAVSGIVAGVILAIARIIGETAPLMVAAGFTQSINMNFFSGPMMTLPTFVYDQYAYRGIPPEAFVDRAWTGALTLILIVMALNLIGRLVAKRFAPKSGR
ncbi:MAG TPA: phosphate ABC transporter permease PstA [Propioniciclava sp.]|jgi:phosphate transport system permease protein|uniref:phosphate ABC transporter permease PstA n=1 Tax=Propioniciclava sp. TaxID=2038686 RepID=UPI002B6B8235|nr:phosphate ABC transporter permease PstA [Propioniciclava sp.]HRL49324.1 phosphate ABC transporter permease PstA [Propioniciclava sp.]HRL79870.1 phosphate ABC transporter permease PstA [Propioniciclava sp.]